MKFIYAEGATPFNQDDATQLIPNHITTQNQLNEWEQANILKAEHWLFSQKRKDMLRTDFLQKLHHKMFSQTWLWAGTFRKHQTNIGVNPFEIAVSLNVLCEDVLFWIQNKTYSMDEIATRFHHRLVLIHPFPNGNGRHARLITDALLFYYGLPRFSWGKVNLVIPSHTRKNYINALRSADQGNIDPLLHFVRS